MSADSRTVADRNAADRVKCASVLRSAATAQGETSPTEAINKQVQSGFIRFIGISALTSRDEIPQFEE